VTGGMSLRGRGPACVCSSGRRAGATVRSKKEDGGERGKRGKLNFQIEKGGKASSQIRCKHWGDLPSSREPALAEISVND